MPDMRLIDANAVDKDIWYGNKDSTTLRQYASGVIAKSPTIDAVPVVRCRDCKHWSGRNDKPGEVTAIGYCDHPNHHIIPLRADWFCADGAKMDLKEETT